MKLKWLLPKFKYQFEVLKLTYKITYDLCPDYFLNYTSLDENFVLRETRRKNYKILSQSSNISPLSFKYQATTLWHELPTNIREADLTFNQFKTKIFDYQLSVQLAENQEQNLINYSCIDDVINKYCN